MSVSSTWGEIHHPWPYCVCSETSGLQLHCLISLTLLIPKCMIIDMTQRVRPSLSPFHVAHVLPATRRTVRSCVRIVLRGGKHVRAYPCTVQASLPVLQMIHALTCSVRMIQGARNLLLPRDCYRKLKSNNNFGSFSKFSSVYYGLCWQQAPHPAKVSYKLST